MNRTQLVQVEAPETSGTIHIALDESFAPLTLVGAAVSETAFAEVNDDIHSLYRELAGYSWMSDLKSFKKFQNEGFHMSNDSQMIADRFVSFLGHAIGYSSYLFFSERTDISNGRLTLLLYKELLRTVLGRYQDRPLIKCYFEQNSALNEYFPKVVNHCLRQLRRPRPTAEVAICQKMDPPLLAVCDYSMLLFARWYKGYGDCEAQTQSSRDFTWRSLNALRRSYAVVRSLESGTVMRRDLPLRKMV